MYLDTDGTALCNGRRFIDSQLNVLKLKFLMQQDAELLCVGFK
jgi:hypothetical protein